MFKGINFSFLRISCCYYQELSVVFRIMDIYCDIMGCFYMLYMKIWGIVIRYFGFSQ